MTYAIFFSVHRLLLLPDQFLLAKRDVLRHLENLQVI